MDPWTFACVAVIDSGAILRSNALVADVGCTVVGALPAEVVVCWAATAARTVKVDVDVARYAARLRRG